MNSAGNPGNRALMNILDGSLISKFGVEALSCKVLELEVLDKGAGVEDIDIGL